MRTAAYLSQPSVRYVLGLESNLHHVKYFKKKLKWEKKSPQMKLIQLARIKVAPNIAFVFLKSLINECDHISSDVGPIPCSWIFKIFKQDLGINQNPLFE